jgi:hypothetical protein
MFLILILWSGKKSIKPKNNVLRPIKEMAISGMLPPYCLKILLGMKIVYSKATTNNPNIVYPQGLLYFPLDKNKK